MQIFVDRGVDKANSARFYLTPAIFMKMAENSDSGFRPLNQFYERHAAIAAVIELLVIEQHHTTWDDRGGKVGKKLKRQVVITRHKDFVFSRL